jgi:uncharacterized tellurite resistance protein B-like protein
MTKIMCAPNYPQQLQNISGRPLALTLKLYRMTPLQNLHSAIGELAYAIARADGQIQRQEAAKFLNIVVEELDNKHYDFDMAQIIFNIMRKEKIDTQTSYDWAMKEIRLNSHYLSPEMKKTFVMVMEKVAMACPPVTIDEMSLLERFKKDIKPLEGDPVYYGSNSPYSTKTLKLTYEKPYRLKASLFPPIFQNGIL